LPAQDAAARRQGTVRITDAKRHDIEKTPLEDGPDEESIGEVAHESEEKISLNDLLWGFVSERN
jgi:hypothetical protein